MASTHTITNDIVQAYRYAPLSKYNIRQTKRKLNGEKNHTEKTKAK